MHAGVFGARISEEAFQILLDILESNFAALNIPEDNTTNREEKGNNNAVVISRRILPAQIVSGNSVVFEENLNIRVSHLIQNHSGQEFRGVLEIVLPIYRNPEYPPRIIMNHVKSLEDSHEPMEIEEISFEKKNEPEIKFDLRKVKKEPNDSKSSEVLRPKIIIRESKLKILELNKETNGEKKAPIITEISTEEEETIDDDTDVQNTKPKPRPLVLEEEEDPPTPEKSTFFYFWQMLFFILLPIAVLVACVTIAREEFDSSKCAHRFETIGAIRDLENRVFGQTQGIKELGDNLAVTSSGLRILAIIGGTGVGKSYAAHIVSENFPVKKNVFQYVPPLKTRRRFASGAISICGCNLIILENLSNKDIPEAVKFAEYIAGKIDEKNYCVFIINVINVQETDDDLKHAVNLTKSKNDIEDIFRDKNLPVKVVQFEHLDDDAVTKCITEAAKSANLTLSKSEIDDVRISLKISDTGCKGAHAKVQLLDKKFDRN